MAYDLDSSVINMTTKLAGQDVGTLESRATANLRGAFNAAIEAAVEVFRAAPKGMSNVDLIRAIEMLRRMHDNGDRLPEFGDLVAADVETLSAGERPAFRQPKASGSAPKPGEQ